MSNEPIQIEIQNENLTKSLEKLSKKVQNRSPIMNKLEERMMYSVKENFRTNGSRLNESWKELSPATKEARNNQGYFPDKPILQQSRNLFQNISSQSDNDSAVVGTNHRYARIHQLGGEIKPRKGNYLLIPINTKKGKDKPKKFLKLKKVTIPARPYLQLNDSDINDITDIIINDLKSINQL